MSNAPSAPPGRPHPPARVVLFDLDGTLVDTLPDIHAAVSALLAELGAAPLPADAVRAMIGDGLPALAAKIVAAAGVRARDAAAAEAYARRLHRHYVARDHAGSTLYPEVAETLAALQAAGFRLGVCTNKYEAAAREVLARLGIGGLFGAVGGGDSFAARKPDPAHVRGVLAQLGTAPEQAVLVGDGINDVLAARAAGVRSVLVAYGYGTDHARATGPDAEVATFAEVRRAVEGLL